MDGYQTTASIRQREKNGQRIPIIAMTAHAFKGDREKCIASGMEDYLAKPVTIDQLEACLKKWSFKNEEPKKTIVEGIDDPVAAQEIVTLYLEQTEKILGELKSAFNKRDETTLKRAAHTIKGSSSYLRLKTILKLAGHVEESTHQNDREKTEELIVELENEFSKFRRTVQGEK